MINADRTILLVEDNKNDELLALRALKKSEISSKISIARDGVEAVDFIFTDLDTDNDKALPVLILLDLNLPKLNGLEVLKRLKSNDLTAQIPVVIMTSSNEDTDINTSYKLGANSYLRKPVDFNEFSLLINNLANYWLVLNRSPKYTH